ncbi:MAG: VacJ family lipoprotein, partial [Burkholderia gladioli]
TLFSASGGPGGRMAGAAVPDYSSDALPKYDVPDDGAAPAAGATPASGAAAAPASDASAATAAQPNPASETHVPAQNVVPPSPNGFRWPSLRLH